MQIAPTSSGEMPPATPRTALQREASRRNGRRSKGPKTPEGKARSSRNARRHGLSVPAIVDPVFHEQIRAFAREITGPSGDPTVWALANLIAAAHIDVQRARHAACALMSAMKPDCSTYSKAVRRLDWIKRYEHRRAVCRDKAVQQLSESLIAARHRARNCETNPTASRIHPDEARRGEHGHAISGSKNREHYNSLMGNLEKRTREWSASSHKTDVAAEKPSAVGAEVSSRCNRAEGRMKKRTRAIPASQWKAVRMGERSAARIHSCKTNPSWRTRIRFGRGRFMRAVFPSIARGHRSRAPGSNRVFRLLH